MTNQSSAVAMGVIGCRGRVGRLLVEELQSGQWPGAALAGGTVSKATDRTSDYFMTDDADALMGRCGAVIDFTKAEVTARTVALAAKLRVPYVTGTTGLNAAQEQELQKAARDIPIVYAANMSVGVTLLAALVEQAAAKLGPDWDIEILETHHKQKVDAPSGTALMLGKAAAKGRSPSPNPLPEGRGLSGQSAFFPVLLQGEGLAGRVGKREAGTIGYAVRRGGDVVGEHDVTFYGMGERIELSHRATDRRLFARGAIRAALWVQDKPPGLYDMRDVLGFPSPAGRGPG